MEKKQAWLRLVQEKSAHYLNLGDGLAFVVAIHQVGPHPLVKAAVTQVQIMG